MRLCLRKRRRRRRGERRGRIGGGEEGGEEKERKEEEGEGAAAATASLRKCLSERSHALAMIRGLYALVYPFIQFKNTRPKVHIDDYVRAM